MKYLIILFIVGIALFVLFKHTSALSAPPFALSEDLAMETQYKKRAAISQINKSYGSTQFAQKTNKLLTETKDQGLSEFRCTDSFMRNDQGVYIFENIRVNNKLMQRIKNDDFIEFMRSKEPNLPRGTKTLTGRICELKDQTLLLFYSIGQYDANPADASISIRKLIAGSTNNKAYLDVFPKNRFYAKKSFEIASSVAHVRCDQSFYIKRNSLLVLCEEEIELNSNYFVFDISLKNGSTKLVEHCSNKFGGEKTLTTCN